MLMMNVVGIVLLLFHRLLILAELKIARSVYRCFICINVILWCGIWVCKWLASIYIFLSDQLLGLDWHMPYFWT
jgi:hypothetical protein